MANYDPVAELAKALAPKNARARSLPDVGFHQGYVIAWNSVTGENTIRVAGAPISNVPVLTSAGSVSLSPGTTVGVIRYQTSYYVIGRIVGPGSNLAQPQQSVVLYPQFVGNGTATYVTVDAGVLVAWEGRANPSLPFIEIDGVWGVASGTGSITYEVKLGGTTYGSETYTTGPVVERLGPYNIDSRIGEDWLKIEVAITASSGTGEMAFGVLGAYFRQA